jgi:putative SOS response-associated peptidase YedK
MCNLYSETKGQAAIRALFRTAHDGTGNLPAFPGIFPDQLAPIVRNSVDGERELVMARWGMPGPPQFGGQPVTNIRNVASPQARRWDMHRRRHVTIARSLRLWSSIPVPLRLRGTPVLAQTAPRRARA